MSVTDRLPLSPRDFLVLLVLADEALHGYGIIRAVRARVGDEVSLDPANLYRSLRRLRREGIIQEATVPPDPDESAEQRRYFELTEFGREVVTAEATRLSRLTAVARDARLLDATGPVPE